MLIDTHAHLNFNAYKSDADEVIRRSLDNNVWIVNVGSQYETSKRAVEIAGKYEKGVYAAVGLHPIHTNEEEYNLEEYKDLAFGKNLERFAYSKELVLRRGSGQAESKTVAIGEIGLDYSERYAARYMERPAPYKPEHVSFKEKQKTVFLEQLELAKELNLPVIFHCRMAHQDLIEILKSKFQNSNSKIEGMIHCFTGNWKQAQQYLEMGLFLGFNGIIFKLNLDKIIEKTPLDKILIETDCPYLTPLISVDQRTDQHFSASTARNEPMYVKYVAQKIAEIKNLSYEEISEITTENAKKLFKI